MKNYIFLIALALFIGCASGKDSFKAISPNTEVVTAEGMAPIVSGDIAGAKKTSLNEAMKSALGLVIGIYVSQEALVSKAVLIEDNITSQTEGYIEKYNILKEWREGDFYKTRIKALVRKEDLSSKLKALDLEPKKLGNPLVKFSIEEFIDGSVSNSTYAQSEIKKKFIEEGFTVSDSEVSDILVTGKVDTNFNTEQALGGFFSYRASIELKVIKSDSKDVITTANAVLGGIDITKSAAARKSISEAAKKVSRDMPSVVLKFLKERSVIQLSIKNVSDINMLNNFIRSVRALTEVRDCWTRNFNEKTALIDMDIRRGSSIDIAKRLEQLSSFSVKIIKTGAYSIEAELIEGDKK